MDGKLYGIREISNYVGAPKHTVNYYIDRWSIQPTTWLSGRRIFNESTVQKFKEMLSDRIASRIKGMCRIVVMKGKDKRLSK